MCLNEICVYASWFHKCVSDVCVYFIRHMCVSEVHVLWFSRAMNVCQMCVNSLCMYKMCMYKMCKRCVYEIFSHSEAIFSRRVIHEICRDACVKHTQTPPSLQVGHAGNVCV